MKWGAKVPHFFFKQIDRNTCTINFFILSLQYQIKQDEKVSTLHYYIFGYLLVF